MRVSARRPQAVLVLVLVLLPWMASRLGECQAVSTRSQQANVEQSTFLVATFARAITRPDAQRVGGLRLLAAPSREHSGVPPRSVGEQAEHAIPRSADGVLEVRLPTRGPPRRVDREERARFTDASRPGRTAR